MGKKDLYRLKDRSTIFTDPDSDFVISGTQQKPLPRKVGSVLAARVRTGALIKADDQPKGGESKPPEEKPLEKSEESQAETAAGEQAEKSGKKPAGKSGKNK